MLRAARGPRGNQHGSASGSSPLPAGDDRSSPAADGGAVFVLRIRRGRHRGTAGLSDVPLGDVGNRRLASVRQPASTLSLTASAVTAGLSRSDGSALADTPDHLVLKRHRDFDGRETQRTIVARARSHSRGTHPSALHGVPDQRDQRGSPLAGRPAHLCPEELAEAARLEQIASLEDVRWAGLEPSGKISFIPK
jgi:hypothetical protein